LIFGYFLVCYVKTRVIAASAILVLLLAGLATAALANSGPAGPGFGLGSPNRGDGRQGNASDNGRRIEDRPACARLTVGETLTAPGLVGHFINATNREIHGNASGTFTFKVTRIYAIGCTLSITGGTFKLNKTTYTVTGGSIVLNRGGESGEGTGTTSGGSFLIRLGGLHGISTSVNVGQIGLDFKSGSQEFLVHLGSDEPGE